VGADEFNVHRIERIRNADNQPETIAADIENGAILANKAY
jgi:hypothetical protein